MTTMTQDYPGHARARQSNSPRLPPMHEQRAPANSNVEAWTDAFAQLQRQVQYNSHAIEDQRQLVSELHAGLRSMHSEIAGLWSHLDMCKERMYASIEELQKRPNPSDIDYLVSQHQAVSSKVHEIDNVKLQLDVMTRRLRRLEGDAPQVDHPVESAYDARHPAVQHQQPQPPQHQTIPPASSETHAQPVQQEQRYAQAPPVTHDQRGAYENPQQGEKQSVPGFRSFEAGAPATSWRPAADNASPAYASAAHPRQAAPVGAAEPHLAAADPLRDSNRETGWAAVNQAAYGKRAASVERAGPQDGHGGPSSPKRQKFATLMPRASVAEQGGSHPEASQSQQYYHAGESQPPIPAAPGASSIRFVPMPRDVSTVVHESWRPEDPSRSRGRGGGRPRGRGRRSGNVSERDDAETRSIPDRAEWTASQYGENVQHHAHHSYAASPPDGPQDREVYPAGYSPPSSHHLSQGPDTPSPNFHDSGKKSRTKPTRNSNGVLIRKDGRPDMRSISSAQNLRKVHAKKEAERNADGTTSQDPSSATSSAPNDDKSSSGDGHYRDDSPTTPEDEKSDKAHRTQSGFAPVNDERRHGRESSASHTPRQGLEMMSERSVSRHGNADGSRAGSVETRKTAGAQDDDVADSVMMDARDAKDGQVGGTREHVAPAVAASG